MDVREDGDAHRQSLAARSAGIGPGRASRGALAAPPGATRHQGRRARAAGWRGYAAPVAPRFVATTRRWSGRPGDTPSTTRIRPPPRPSTARRPASSSSSSRSLFQATSDPPRASSGNASSTSSGSGADGPGDDRRPALALARVGGEVLDAGRRDLDRRREAGRGHRRRRGTTPSCGSTRRAAPAPQATRPRAGCRGSRRRCRRRRTPGPRAGEAREPRRGCRGRAAGRARAGRGAAVRLIAAFQARRRRTWPSIAARAPRRQREPDRREALVEDGRELRRELGKALNARRERITRTVQALLLSVVPRIVRAPLPASFRRTAGRSSVFRGRSGSRPGLPVPLASPVTRVTSVRMPDVNAGRRVVNGVIHESTPPLRGCG